MTPEQISLVQQSFQHVIPIRAAAAEIFYTHLFTMDPDLRKLFTETDMAKQGAKLMASLGFVVHGLDRAESILPAVRALARRHVGYGVEETHYETVGRALLATLADGLGPSFTPETRAAWAEAYALLAGVMIEAANEEASPRASATAA